MRALQCSVSQGHLLDSPAATAGSGRWPPATNLTKHLAPFLADMLLDRQKCSKPQVRYLAPPQALHRLDIQVFEDPPRKWRHERDKLTTLFLEEHNEKTEKNLFGLIQGRIR